MANPIIYNLSKEKTAVLENVLTVSYKMELNSLWTASFSLPAKDPKNAYCQPLYYIELFDGDERIDLFRIIGEDLTRSNDAIKVYDCEHVLATLLNDVLFQYHQVGGVSTDTSDVIDYILGEQTTANWTLDTCDYTRNFEYSFENENLLSALFAIPKPFDTDFVWTWDTTVYPWELNLEELPTTIASEIRYGKNLIEVQKNRDFSTLANKIYALGYGEGTNQLTIHSANPGVVTSDTKFQLGTWYFGLTGTTFTNLYPSDTETATTYIAGTSDVEDWTDGTKASHDSIYEGIAYVSDATSISTYGVCPTILVDARYENAETLKGYADQILAESKDPYTTYEVSAIDLNRLSGTALSKFVTGELIRVIDTEDDIAVTTRIVSVEKSDVDGDPGNVKITIANKAKDIAGSISDLQNRARINETYAQGATNLQAQTFADNADNTHPLTFKFYIPTETVRINKVQLTVDFEEFRAYSTAASSGGGSTSGSGGGSTVTSAGGGGTTWTEMSLEPDTSGNVDPYYTQYAGTHNHGIADGAVLQLSPSGTDTFSESGSHRHEVNYHYHEIETTNHTHSVTIADHTHTTPNHTHDLAFGIYEGLTAASATITADGNSVSVAGGYDDLDLVGALDVDSEGKITRGAWHTVSITPNQMSRIVGSLFIQLFTNSRGGGDY